MTSKKPHKKKINEISPELAIRLASISLYTEEALNKGSHKFNFIEVKKLFCNVELQRWLTAVSKRLKKVDSHLKDCSFTLLGICDCGIERRQ